MVLKHFTYPIKYTGISMNRIMFSNTRVAVPAFPDAKEQQFELSFRYKTYLNGKSNSSKCKLRNHL